MVYYRDVPTALPSDQAYGAFMNDVSEMSGGGAIPFMTTPGNGEVNTPLLALPLTRGACGRLGVTIPSIGPTSSCLAVWTGPGTQAACFIRSI